VPRPPRPVIPDERTWLGPDFKKHFALLTPAQKAICKGQLAELIESLGQCGDPITDINLKKWRPKSYHVANFSKAGCRLAEYSFDELEGMRVIVVYFAHDETVLLATVTLIHDHKGMQKTLRDHSARISADSLKRADKKK
jgi:hypothetical protein